MYSKELADLAFYRLEKANKDLEDAEYFVREIEKYLNNELK